jgi:hypothetical protein
MLIKVKIQTDEKGKYYNHKKKKTYIESKCVKLLPKKDDINIYVNDDGAKYYHIGYKKVYLGNNIQVSKNVCGDLEKVFSHKKRKLDKAIVESIEEIKKVKKRKKRAKKTKTKEAVESIKGVIKNDLLDNKLKDEDYSNKKPQKLSYAQTRAKLIQANDKVQQIKNDAEQKGYTKDQKARVVSEAKQLLTMTPEQRQLQQTQSTLPALNSLYGSSVDWSFNSQGIPIFPPQDRKIERKTADQLVKEREEEREKEMDEWLENNPPIKLEKPKKTTISNIFGGIFGGKTSSSQKSVDLEEAKDSDDEDDVESVVSSVASKTPSLASNSPPMSSEERSKKTAILELETRLLDIQNYIDKDIKDVERFKIHLELLNEPTIPEKKKVAKIKTEVNKRRKELIEEYKTYVGDIIPVFVQSEKENPFSTDVIKKFGKKKQVERILKQIHKVEADDKKPKTIDSYNQLNMLVDTAKHKPEFRKKAIDSSIDRHIQQLERFANRLEKGVNGTDFQDRIDYAVDILKRFKPVGDSPFKIPTKLYKYITKGGEIGYGKAKPVVSIGVFKNKISKWGDISAGLEEEPDYYSNTAFDTDVYSNIKTDIRSKFSNTDSSLLTDGMFDRAYFGDKLDKDEVVDTGIIKGNKKSASSGLDVLTGSSILSTTMTSSYKLFGENEDDGPPSPEGKAVSSEDDDSLDSFDRNMLAQGMGDDYVAYQEGATTPVPDY